MFASSPAWITASARRAWHVLKVTVLSAVAATRSANRSSPALATSALIPANQLPAVDPTLCAALPSIAANAPARMASKETQRPNRAVCAYQPRALPAISVPADTCALAINVICPAARHRPVLWASAVTSRSAERSATPATIVSQVRFATAIAPVSLAVSRTRIVQLPSCV